MRFTVHELVPQRQQKLALCGPIQLGGLTGYTQDNWITITRKRKMAKASNYDEKKRSSPTNRNKTTTFALNSPLTKHGRKEFFQRNNRSSKKGKSSATNTQQGNHTSSTTSCSKLFSLPRREKKSSNPNLPNTSTGKAREIPISSIRKNCSRNWASPANNNIKVPRGPAKFENETPAETSPHNSCNHKRDSCTREEYTQPEPSLISKQSEPEEVVVESPNIGNPPVARSPVESFNLGTSSPTVKSSVGPQNQPHKTGETDVKSQNSYTLPLSAVR